MKIRLLLLFSGVFSLGVQAQEVQSEAHVNCGTPPPPGYNNVYGLDTDNDGFALFDLQYYVDHFDRPEMESYFGVSSSGYVATFYAEGVSQPFLYTNTSQNQEAWLGYQYNGAGPEFSPQPPCYWLVEWYFGSRGLLLVTVPHDGDDDSDGILNAEEDTNHNQNLMDDDDDGDGLINLKDNVNNLVTVQHTSITLNVYPNPVTGDLLSFESNVAIKAITIYDITGKQLLKTNVNAPNLNLAELASGVYLFRFESEEDTVIKKIVVQ